MEAALDLYGGELRLCIRPVWLAEAFRGVIYLEFVSKAIDMGEQMFYNMDMSLSEACGMNIYKTCPEVENGWIGQLNIADLFAGCGAGTIESLAAEPAYDRIGAGRLMTTMSRRRNRRFGCLSEDQ